MFKIFFKNNRKTCRSGSPTKNAFVFIGDDMGAGGPSFDRPNQKKIFSRVLAPGFDEALEKKKPEFNEGPSALTPALPYP